MKTSRLYILLFFAVVMVLVAAAFAAFFQQIPLDGNTLAMDWRVNWPSLAAGLPYQIVPPLLDHLPYPPWSMLPLLPLGLFPMQVTWGWWALFSLIVLIVSVPRIRKRWLYWVSVPLLVFSYPAIRTLVDGNPEALILAGILLILSGLERQNAFFLAAGILLATAKPQTLTLFLLATSFYVIRDLPQRVWLKSLVLVLVVVIPALLWRGENWIHLMLTIPQQGSIMNISLMAALERAAVLPLPLNWVLWGFVMVATLFVIWSNSQPFSREKAGLLIAGSLLIAPYAANTLSLLAIGVIPLFQKRHWLGAFLIALNWMLTLFNQPTYRDVLGYISTVVLFLTWSALLWSVWRANDAPVTLSKTGDPALQTP